MSDSRESRQYAAAGVDLVLFNKQGQWAFGGMFPRQFLVPSIVPINKKGELVFPSASRARQYQIPAALIAEWTQAEGS